MSESRRRGGGSLAAGLILIFIGSWFSLDRLGVELPDFPDLWPMFPFLIGAAFLLSFFAGRTRDPGIVWPGTAGVLIGLFFALFTLGPLRWWQMEELWPVLPLIAGVAFLATWLAGRARQGGLLIPAVLLIAFGFVGLAITYGLFEDWLIPAVEVGWPVALIVIGLYIVLRSLARRREVS